MISAVRNEAGYISRTLASVVSQTVLPDRWVIVDDGSTDDTLEIVAQCAREHPFITVADASSRHRSTSGSRDAFATEGVDGLAQARDAKAFNYGLTLVTATSYGFVAKIDGDLEFGRDYFERILRHFATNPGLGIAGGHCYEPHGDGLKMEWVPDDHVRGATKIYRRECFAQIGGMREVLGWDTIDEILAQMYGWQTRSFKEPRVIHLRPTGSALGSVRGKMRHGRAAYYLGYNPIFLAVRCVRNMFHRPRLLGGAAMFAGFVSGYLARADRMGDEETRRFLRRRQRRRLLGRRDVTAGSQLASGCSDVGGGETA